jgi:hypothetical protein
MAGKGISSEITGNIFPDGACQNAGNENALRSRNLTLPKGDADWWQMETKPTMKVLGRGRLCAGGLKEANGFLKMVVRLREGQPFVPRGVYRFHSHEELDAWTMKMLTRPSAAPRR